MRLHAPELSETVARRLVELVGMVRDLDLKKPPSIAESIDWARALLLLGAKDIDATLFTETMSVIVKHRTDMDVVAERVGMKLSDRPDAAAAMPAAPERLPAGLAGQLLASARSCETRASGRHLGAARRFRRAGQISWTSQADFKRGARGDAGKEPGGQAHIRAACSTASCSAPSSGRHPEMSERIGEGAAARCRSSPTGELSELRAADRGRAAQGSRARCATSRCCRSRPSAATDGSGVIGVDVQRIRRALGLRAEQQPELPPEDPRRDGLPRDALRRFEAHLRRELERAQIQRAGSLPPARPLGELDRALPSGPLADLAAVHRVVAQLRRRLATQGWQTRGHAPSRPRRRAPHDARVAADRRCAGGAEVPPPPPAAPRAVRAVRRLHERDLRVGLLPLGAACAPRHVSQDALVRVHRAHLGGHRHLRARARLQSRQRADRQRRRRGRHLRLHRLRSRVVGVPGAGGGRSATRARR